MVNKETVGKIQLWIGIILLIIAIIGVIWAWDGFNKGMINAGQIHNGNRMMLENESVSNNYSESTIRIIERENSLMAEEMTIFYYNKALILEWGFILLLILSLLFITQGLVNISEEK